MKILTLEDVKEFLKVDYEDEDALITSLIEASEIYLKNATGIEYDNTNEQAKLYCRVLVYEWFRDKNLMKDEKVSNQVKFTLQSILLQLQYGGGTGGEV